MNMLSILPPPDIFISFLIAGIALNVTPGSDMTFVALSGARGGRSAGLAAAAGIFVGCFAHIVFAVAGLSALIAASQTAFAVVKWMGVVYLLYLAYQLLQRNKGDSCTTDGSPQSSRRSVFRQAALINLLNPKVGIFFLAFLPQFIEPGAASPWQQILVLGIVFNTTGAIVNVLVATFSAIVARRLAGNSGLSRGARWFASTIMGCLAVKLAVTRNA
jgi:threonine/homoserine/homoserine lactone efflux protein